MKICYLLESTDLWGGVKVVLDHSRGLKKLGHEVIVRSLGGDHGWYPHAVNVVYVDRLDAPFANDDKPDVVIGTFWSTMTPALNLAAPLTVHFCQGYEGDHVELPVPKETIDACYRLPIPKFVYGEWLTKRLVEVYGKDAFPIYPVGQLVDTDLFKPGRQTIKNIVKWFLCKKGSKRFPIKIMVVGDSYISCKGIPDALNAVAILRKKGYEAYLIRVSLWPMRDEDREITEINEAHVKIPLAKMAALYRSVDLFIAPSHAAEGFGLPFAESMACGLPAVATKIGSFLSLDAKKDYAMFVPEKSPMEIAEKIEFLLRHPMTYLRLAIRGPLLVRKRLGVVKIAENVEKGIKKFLK